MDCSRAGGKAWVVGDAQIEALIAATLETTPVDARTGDAVDVATWVE